MTAIEAPAAVEAGHGHGDQHATLTSNAKLAIWMFLASDFLFFGAFISAFMLYRGRPQNGKVLADVLDIPFTSATSFILLMSSLTMVLALAAIRRGDQRRTRVWLLATCFFGMTFIGGQIYEFTSFVREGFTVSSNLSGSTFFVLTGLHGVHVTIGIIWLLSLFGLSQQGRLKNRPVDGEKVEIAGLYWHFVDVIWIVIFTLIYLIPYKK
jgi:cytochrome c oxidase subunit 3/cytochrome o ubiquinol oxidase subunit 3